MLSRLSLNASFAPLLQDPLVDFDVTSGDHVWPQVLEDTQLFFLPKVVSLLGVVQQGGQHLLTAIALPLRNMNNNVAVRRFVAWSTV
jgi:hypothetical protein